MWLTVIRLWFQWRVLIFLLLHTILSMMNTFVDEVRKIGLQAAGFGNFESRSGNMADTYQLVTFQLGEEIYGVDILDVKEIVRVQEVRPIPNAPAYVEGIFNLRREIIPIINLHKRFFIKKPPISE